MDLTYDECKCALRLRLNAMNEQPMHWQNPCTSKQCQSLVILLNQGLNDQSREVRLALIKEMIDIPVQSTKDLLKWEASCLIDFLKEYDGDWSLSDGGRNFIEEAERRVTKCPEVKIGKGETYQFSFA